MMKSSSFRLSVNGLAFLLCCFAVFLEVCELALFSPGLPLRFVIEPQSVFLAHNSPEVLDCVVEPGNADVRWYYNGSLMTTDKQESRGTGERRVSLISTAKLGYFYCVANSSNCAVRSLPALVSSAYLSNFSDGLADRTIGVIANNTAVIPCATPIGQPSTVTEFEVNSTLLVLTDRHLILPSGNLQIVNVRAEDSGVYRCIAVNPLTGDRRYAPTVITLEVKEPVKFSQPRFTWTPHSHLEVVQGQNLTLECAAEGWPVPLLTWKRYGGVLPAGRSATMWGNLMINRVRKSDEGTYICQAEVNATHSQDYVAFIDVLEPPVVTLLPSDQNVTQFDSVTLVCLASGSPKISITWYHNGLPVVTSQQVIVSSNGSLTLHNVQLRHSGIYQCFAENSVGVAYGSSRLMIGVRETDLDFGQALDDEMQNVAPSNDGQPPGRRPGGARKLKKLPKNSSSRPRSTSSPDAVTDFADSTKDGVEEEDGTPATLLPPSKPVVARTSDTSVLLNWTVVQNGSLPVVFFKIQLKEIVGGKKKNRWETRDEEIAPLSRSYEVLSLKSGAVYQFRIAAVYSNHDNKIGPISERVSLKTSLPTSNRSRAPVSSPMIVNVHENITSFVVFWQYQPIERVTIDGFKVFYKPYDDDVDYRSIKVMGSDSRDAEITDLKPDTSYSIHMVCFNAEGESNSSLSVARKTLGLFGYLVTPFYEKEFIEPSGNERTMTTTAVRAYYATNRINTHASNELLFIVLGVVLGVMMLVLCVVMVMCACKQRQQRRLLAALDGRRKFHDPSKTLYVGSQMKSAPEGSFLLNGIGAAPKKPTANGYLSVRGNGVAPGINQPTSEYELSSTCKAEAREEEVPLRSGQNSSEYDEPDGVRSSRFPPFADERTAGCDPASPGERPLGTLPEPPSGCAAAAVIYRPPEDLPTISRPRDVPFQQPSLKSSRSSCDYRLHGNDGGSGESYQATASPDHIPRLHECQLLYRSPEHTRRSRDRTRGRHEQLSDRSLSASSQASGSHTRAEKHSNVASEPCHSKITSVLPADSRSSDGDSRQGDSRQGDSRQGDSRQGDSRQGDSRQGDSRQGDSRQGDAIDSAVPVGSRVSWSTRSSHDLSDSRNGSDCMETRDNKT